MTQHTIKAFTVWGILILLFGLLYIVAHFILVASFNDLEEDTTRRNVQRVINALSNEAENLSITTADWSSWDDTYTFVEDQNEAYIAANLTNEALYTLQLNMMLFVDTSGQIVFEKTVDLENEEPISLGSYLIEHLTEDGLLLHNGASTDNISGIIQLPDYTLLVAVYPILTSADEGPGRGTTIFGRIVDTSWVNQLADSIQLELVFETWNTPNLPSDFHAMQSTVAESSEIAVQPLNSGTIAGYTVIDDIYGDPALFVRVDVPRDIYHQGQTTLAYFAGALVIIGLLFGAVASILLEKNRLANEQFEIILHNSIDAICLVRPNGVIVQTNPAFNSMFTSASNDFQKQVQDVFRVDADNRIIVAFNEIIRDKQPNRLDAVAYNSSGKPSNFDILLSPILGADHWISGVVCSFRDITAQKQTEEQLRRALAHETELSKMKAQFVSMASHELRTPLTEIKLAQEFLHRYGERLDEERKKQKLDRISASIDHMQNLLEDVLTLSSVKSGQFAYNPEPFDVAQYSKHLVENIIHTDGTARKIAVSTSGDLQNVRLDPKLLRHIIDNLLSNALKYSECDTTVYLDVTGNNRATVFTVRDEGMGIPVKEQSQMFDTFFRGKTVVNIPGTGLGLAIVKQAVDAHAGTITVESTEGLGTTVVVKLPNADL